MPSLQLFQYEGREIRTFKIDGEPWFAAVDVCAALDVGNPSQALTRLDDDESTLISNEGREMNLVSESGLYSLVLGSRKQEAKEFKRWITREVIPSIRRTGSYSKPLTLAERTALIMGELDAMVQSQRQQLVQQAPLVAQAELSRDADGHETIGDLANRIQLWAASNYPSYKVLHRDVFDLAGELGVIIRGNTVRNNQPTSQAIKANWVKVKETVVETNNHGNKLVTSIRLTPRGTARIWDAALHRITTALPLTISTAKAAA